MKKLFIVAAVCFASLSSVPRAQADFVCRLNELEKELLKVRVGPNDDSIEVGRLSPGTIVNVVERPPEGVWIRITSPGRPSGWVLANSICPGQPQ
jgi:uncharacterized protein YgiM (DUF1202 family)